MANWKAGTSSDAVGASGCEYDVFLNFRGQDTCHNFTDLFYDGLVDAGVHTFRDEEKLPVGDVISDRLEHAINNSKLYISIFSRNYASSKWCLRELKLIMDNVSNSRGQKSIVPIFFFVEPDDLKLKTRPDRDAPYKAAFEAYEKEFSNEAQAWKTALGKVDERKGWVVKEDTSQAAIVKLVVKEVLEKLKIKQKSVTKHLVGLDGRIKELTKLLDVNHNDVRLIGIYGMGGIGKTTIAMVIFNQLYTHFGKCCSFLEGIREKSTKERQKKLLSDIGGSTYVGKIKDSEEGMRRIGVTLNNKKVLVVLDDVDKKVSIKNLIGNSKLYRGSRIIITTRDISVLEVEGFKDGTRKYEMLQMDVDSALKLFCQHAFSRDSPLDGYCQLSSDIVLSLGGLPLAIEVIGSLLNGKDQEIWKETLDKSREVPEKEILEKLRISYDDLENHHKQIFLDIACFFWNENKTDAIYMWTACKFYPNRRIEVLTNRCLVKILDNDQFQMHDQLIVLGRQIVREDSPHDLEKQSRLWIAEEALQIMRTNEVKHKVQALELFRDGPPIEIRDEDFERLPNLRILDLKWGTFAGNFTSCPNLRWFSWDYSLLERYLTMSNFYLSLDLDFRADNLYLDRLVVCKLNYMDFEDDSKAWDLIKRAHNLKVLSISSCSGITTIPNVSRCSSLERLTVDYCEKLKRIESFIGDLPSLIELKIKQCYNFTNLPKEVGALVKLKRLSLPSCFYLSELPSSLGNLTSLMELDLSGPKIRELPNFIGELKSLRILRFPLNSFQFREHHDWQLPSGISTLVNLEELDLSRHNGMKGEIPVGEQTSLRILNLRQTGISKIPRTINKLHNLQTLDLIDCDEIQELPELPTSLNYLFFRSLSLHLVPNLSKLTNLVKLVLSDGNPNHHKPKLFPGCDIRWIGNLSKLKWLELDLLNVPVPFELASLSLLKEVLLTRMDLKPLAQLPSSCWSLRNLSTLHIFSCVAEDISLDGLLQLESIICKCKRLKRLSIPSELRKLRDMEVFYCPELVELRVVGLSKSLKDLSVQHCKSLTRISGLNYLKNLKTLAIRDCKVTDIEGLDELESLEILCVEECRSLRRLIDASCTKIPDNCSIEIAGCGYSIKDSKMRMPLKRYREEVLLDTSKKISFTIRFHLGVKKSSERFEFVGGIEREKEGVDPYSLTYEGLVADVKNFGFGLKRMWYRNHVPFMEIKSDEEVNRMLRHSSRNRFLIHLSVEGWVHSEWEGEYDDEMMEMLREERRMKTDVHPNEDEPKWWGVSCSDFDSDLDFDSTSFADLVPSPISFTIRFHLGGKKSSEPSEWYGCIGGIEREKEVVDPSSLTYEGLIADVKNFGFRVENMWHEIACGARDGIRSDEGVNRMLRYAFGKRLLIHLLVEGGVDSEWEGEYDEEMMKMLKKERRMKTNVYSDEDGAKGDVSWPNEDSNSAPVGGESEAHGTSSVDHFELEWGNAECFEATTSIAEKNLDTVKKQVELHKESRDEKTITSKGCREEIFLNTLKKTQDGAEFDISGSNEVPDSASVGESETDCNSSIDDFRLEPGNTECFGAKGNRRQMRDGRIWRCDSIDGGKTASIKNRKKEQDEIGEPANPSDFVGSSGQTCKGVEHYEKSCKATTEVEDQKDFSSVKRDKTEIDQVPPKTGRGSGTGCASNQGRDPTERGRGRGRASSSRNGEGLSLGRDAASTLGRGTASNSGRYIASSSQSSTTSSLRRDRGSTSGEGTTLTSGRGMTLSLGMGRGSSSRMDTTKMGTTSNPRRGITSSLRSSASLSIGRGRGSTLGEGATVSSGRGMTLSLGTGRGSSSRSDTTKMGTASIPGRGITSSSQSGTSLSTGRGRGSTSVKDTTASSRRGKTLSSGRGATKMGTSSRSGMNKGLSSAKAEPQTSRSLEEQ